jgi:spore cortex formation protein SpoVR/YcgB (stage V sporulation)
MDRITFKEDFEPVFRFWDEWIRTVAHRKGWDPYIPYYRFSSNEEIGSSEAYVGFPVFPGTWANGKQFVGWMKRFESGRANAAYELILNTGPEAYTYMREESMMPLNCLIVAHANVGHAHFFKNNKLFTRNGGADTILERMAKWADRFEQLANDPDFGIERLEYTADAAVVISHYSQETSTHQVSNKELRKRLQNELRRLQGELSRAAVGFDAERLEKRIASVKSILARDPINRTRDIASFILDPEQNPGLSDQEREVIQIVVDVDRYFSPQARTKMMNEGSAEFANKNTLQDAQTCLPHNWKVYLSSHFWSMFEGDPMNRYTSPYWFSRYIFEKLAERHCPIRGEIEVPVPVFRRLHNPMSESNQLGALVNGNKPETAADHNLNPDRSSWMLDEQGNQLEPTGQYRLMKVPDQDLSKIFEVIEMHEDLTFLHEFADHKTLQEIHDMSLRWIDDRFVQITRNLQERGWHPSLYVNPVPKNLDDKIAKVQLWLGAANNAEQFQKELGNPRFPALDIELQWMMQLLMLIRAYHAHKERFREQHIARLTISYAPDMSVIDGGVDSSHGRTLIIEHIYDPLTGQLNETWTRNALQLIPRIWKQGGVKLLTKKDEVDEETGENVRAFDFFYAVDVKGELTEGRL